MKKLTLLLGLALPLGAKGPPNDDFSKAEALPDSATISKKGSLTDSLDRFRATKQEGEPDHAGQKGNGSVWYSWTPKNSRKVQVHAMAENMDLVIAVYTGSSIDDLTLVHRYENFAYPAFSRKRTEPFSSDARVEFPAEAGTMYYFAIDSENPVFESFTLNLSPCPNPFSPQMELLQPGSNWEFLLPTNADGKPIDPKVLDEDFYYTWMFPERYDGPDFLNGSAPIGYGELDAQKIKSNILGKRGTKPPNGERHSAYLRTTFTSITDVSAIGIEGVIDDGAIIYLNGKEATRLNITDDQNPQDWKTTAIASGKNGDIAKSTELMVQYAIVEDLNLKADTPVHLSISLHNILSTSSGMGLDLRIYSIDKKGAR
jgi:hypothetical protein